MEFDDDELSVIMLALRCLRDLADDDKLDGAPLTCVTYCADRGSEIRDRILQRQADMLEEKNDGR